MLFVSSKEACCIFDINSNTLIQSASRNSPKYPFIRLENSGSKGRGGVKLLFEVSLTQLSEAINSNKISADTKIYLFDNQNINDYEIVKFNELIDKKLGYGILKDNALNTPNLSLVSKPNNNSKNGLSKEWDAADKLSQHSKIKEWDAKAKDTMCQNHPSKPTLSYFATTPAQKKKADAHLAIVQAWLRNKSDGLSVSEIASLGESLGLRELGVKDISTLGIEEFENKANYLTSNLDANIGYKFSQSKQIKDKINQALNCQIAGVGDNEFSVQQTANEPKTQLNMQAFCALLGVSSSNLCRWMANYKAKGIIGLVDTRGRAKESSIKLAPWMKQFCDDYFKAYGANGINVNQLYKDLHKEHFRREGLNYYDFLLGKSKPLFSPSVIGRYLKAKFKKGTLEHTLITKGYDKAVSYHAPAAGKQDHWVSRRNQCWQIDSSPLDAFVRDGEGGAAIRAHVISVVDVFSRRCVAMIAPRSNSLAIIRLLKKAFDTLGKPEIIIGDNGKDYMSNQVQHLLKGLGISYDAVRPYTGSDKAFVERHFRTLFHSGLKSLSGYIGHNLATREAIEAQVAKKYRKAFDKYGHIKKTNCENLLTFEQMQTRFEALVMEWDLCTIGRKISPVQRWNSCDAPLVKVDESEFMLYAGGVMRKKITNKGITIDGIRYFASELACLVGSEVNASVNINNVSECFVFDLDGKFICKAIDSQMLAMSAEEFGVANKLFKKRLSDIVKLSKEARVSFASKLSLEYDLNLAKQQHVAALKNEGFKSNESAAIVAIKQRLRVSDSLKEINRTEFDYLKFAPANQNSKKEIRLEDIIKIAVG